VLKLNACVCACMRAMYKNNDGYVHDVVSNRWSDARE
jgi:hypothetical protein